MRTLICIAVDDEAMALEVIKSHLGKIPFMKAEAFFTDALAALAFLQENSVDVVFLDIQMPDLHGTQMARLIDGHMRVIFYHRLFRLCCGRLRAAGARLPGEAYCL